MNENEKENTVQNNDGSITKTSTREILDSDGSKRTETINETFGKKIKVDTDLEIRTSDVKYNSEEVSVIKKGGKEITTRVRIHKDQNTGNITKTTIKEIKNRDGTLEFETNVETMDSPNNKENNEIRNEFINKKGINLPGLIMHNQKPEMNNIKKIEEDMTKNGVNLPGIIMRNDKPERSVKFEQSFKDKQGNTSNEPVKIELITEIPVELETTIKIGQNNDGVDEKFEKMKKGTQLIENAEIKKNNDSSSNDESFGSEPEFEATVDYEIKNVKAELITHIPIQLQSSVDETNQKIEAVRPINEFENETSTMKTRMNLENQPINLDSDETNEKAVRPNNELENETSLKNNNMNKENQPINSGSVENFIKNKYIKSYQLTEQQYKLIRDYFQRFEKDELISKKLFKDHLMEILGSKKKVRANEIDIMNALEIIDIDSDTLDFDEFIDFMTLFFASKTNIKSRIMNVLNGHQFSHVKHGFLTPEEANKFRNFLEHFYNNKNMKVNEEFTSNLNYAEFAKYMQQKLNDFVFVKN